MMIRIRRPLATTPGKPLPSKKKAGSTTPKTKEATLAGQVEKQQASAPGNVLPVNAKAPPKVDKKHKESASAMETKKRQVSGPDKGLPANKKPGSPIPKQTKEPPIEWEIDEETARRWRDNHEAVKAMPYYEEVHAFNKAVRERGVRFVVRPKKPAAD